MTPAQALRGVAEQFGVDALYGFGSRAAEALSFVDGRGAFDAAHPSDLDLAALPAVGRQWDAADRVALTDALEHVFAARRVDLVVLPEAPALLALSAVSGELLYVRDRHREAEYQLFVLRRAGDLAPFERERREYLLQTPLS
jgi:hypothetical protein